MPRSGSRPLRIRTWHVRLWASAQRYAGERFNIARFVKDWMDVFATLTA